MQIDIHEIADVSATSGGGFSFGVAVFWMLVLADTKIKRILQRCNWYFIVFRQFKSFPAWLSGEKSVVFANIFNLIIFMECCVGKLTLRVNYSAKET